MAWNEFDSSRYNYNAQLNEMMRQNRKDKASQWEDLGAAMGNVAQAVDQNRMNAILRANTNADGTYNEAGIQQAVAQYDPTKGYALNQANQQKQLALQKSQADIAKINSEAERNKAQSGAYAAQQTIAKIKAQSDGLKDVGNQIIASNSQAEADLVLSNAKKMGIDTSMFEGKKFSPELKQQAYNMITTETDRLNNRINTIRANVDQASEIRQQQQFNYTQGQDIIKNQREDNKVAVDQNKILAVQQNTAAKQQIAKQQAFTQDTEKFNKIKTEALEGINSYDNKNQMFNNAIGVITKTIQDLQRDPSLTGTISSTISGLVSQLTGVSTATGEYRGNIGQIQGQAFLGAVQNMKGMGALSDAEGKTLKEAEGNLAKNQSASYIIGNLETMRGVLVGRITTNLKERKQLADNVISQGKAMSAKYQQQASIPSALPTPQAAAVLPQGVQVGQPMDVMQMQDPDVDGLISPDQSFNNALLGG